MNEIKIEKNVPIPVCKNNYPWAEMEVGDSFFVDGVITAEIGAAKYRAEKKTGFKFTSKKERAGVRVWRAH